MADASRTSAAPRQARRRATRTPSSELARLVVEAMLSKKALEVTVIDVRKVSGVTDYFVICTGQSDLQVRAVYEAVQEQVKEAVGERPWKKEGADRLQWVVLDYVDVVVHIFDAERRTFYDIERLWGDAPTEHVAEDADEVALLSDARSSREES